MGNLHGIQPATITRPPLGASTPATESAISGLIANCLLAASQGCIDAYFDLGVAFSTGSHGAVCDLIEAHKWFNLAAVGGMKKPNIAAPKSPMK
jgi:hypothetical protein